MLERTIHVDGVVTRYLSAGTGLPLVLLHGAGDNARDWSYVLSLLGRSHQVFAPTCPVTAIAVGRRRPGAALRAVVRALLLFGRPWRTPGSWLVEQYRAARQPGFLEATAASLRGPRTLRPAPGAAKRLAELRMPLLVAAAVVMLEVREHPRAGCMAHARWSLPGCIGSGQARLGHQRRGGRREGLLGVARGQPAQPCAVLSRDRGREWAVPRQTT